MRLRCILNWSSLYYWVIFFRSYEFGREQAFQNFLLVWTQPMNLIEFQDNLGYWINVCDFYSSFFLELEVNIILKN